MYASGLYAEAADGVAVDSACTCGSLDASRVHDAVGVVGDFAPAARPSGLACRVHTSAPLSCSESSEPDGLDGVCAMRLDLSLRISFDEWLREKHAAEVIAEASQKRTAVAALVKQIARRAAAQQEYAEWKRDKAQEASQANAARARQEKESRLSPEELAARDHERQLRFDEWRRVKDADRVSRLRAESASRREAAERASDPVKHAQVASAYSEWVSAADARSSSSRAAVRAASRDRRLARQTEAESRRVREQQLYEEWRREVDKRRREATLAAQDEARAKQAEQERRAQEVARTQHAREEVRRGTPATQTHGQEKERTEWNCVIHFLLSLSLPLFLSPSPQRLSREYHSHLSSRRAASAAAAREKRDYHKEVWKKKEINVVAYSTAKRKTVAFK